MRNKIENLIVDSLESINNTQIIGIDVGRGFLKGYSVYNNEVYQCMFKSLISLGRDIDTSKYKNPIHIEFNSENYFVGELAEIEGDNTTPNLRDDKTTHTVQVLVAAALSKLAVVDNVKIIMGVPNKIFDKINMDKIVSTYKGKIFKVKDKLTNSYKKVLIEDITIFREGDAALIWYTKDRNSLDKPFGMVTVGFRTSEFSYFDKNFRFNDKLSITMELGNKNALEYVQKELKRQQIMKTTAEIDSSDEYDDLKRKAYRMLQESIMDAIQGEIWKNHLEMEIKIAGGTPMHFTDMEYELIPESQMATAKGLFYVGEELF